jgi:hypothetical protein
MGDEVSPGGGKEPPEPPGEVTNDDTTIERAVHHGRWWSLEDDGSILWWDDDRQEWDLWEGALSEPMPPPSFAKPEVSPIFRPGRTPLDIVLFVAAGVFVVSGLVWVVLQVYLAFSPFTEGSFFDDDSREWLYSIGGATYALWQISVGTVIVAVALQARRYFATKAIVDADRDS